jgi:hypothetical protein
MQVQTEAEEILANVQEAAVLTHRVYKLTGRLPRVIEEQMDRDEFTLNDKSASEIAGLCTAIREEFPSLDLGTP